MKVLVTGAGGFLGRAVVAKGAEAGHDIIAMVRPKGSLEETRWPGAVSIVRGDLRQAGQWQNQLEGIEAVIHLAASPSGDLSEQFAGTVIATENLLASLPSTVRRFVHVSSFSVYDYGAIGAHQELDEQSAVELRPQRRDAYTWTKLIQEKLVVDHWEAERSASLVIIRPGAIFGPGKDWDFGRAMQLGGFDLIFAPFARMRLTYVDNCADAIVRALDLPEGGGPFNIVDRDLPTHASYHRMCRRAGALTGRAVYVPWVVVATGGLLIRAINRMFFKGRAKLPEILDYPRQQARWKPLQYRHGRAVKELGWTPGISIAEGVIRTFQSVAIQTPEQGARDLAALARRTKRVLHHREITFGLPEAVVLAIVGVAIAVITVAWLFATWTQPHP